VKTVTTPRLPPNSTCARSPFFVVLLSFLMAAVASPVSSASSKHDRSGKPYALIIGTVWGPDDRPVYGVRVKIRLAKDKPKKVRWELYSDHNGEFAQRVPAGETDYVLSADLKGFKPSDGKPVHLVQEVTLHIYNDERADTGLHLAH